VSVRAGRSRLCGGVSSERRVRADCEGEGLVVCVRGCAVCAGFGRISGMYSAAEGKVVPLVSSGHTG